MSTRSPVVAWLVLVAGCSVYETGGKDECYSLADCNPKKECGEMILCVDGKCNADQTTILPCEQECALDSDCPDDMHCRRPDAGPGVCVADGTCVDAGECLGLPHDDCLGGFECRDERCRWKCLDYTSCNQDADCVLADKGCCCGSRVEDYIAVREDKRTDWESREECMGVRCDPDACNVPEGMSAVCRDGQCGVLEVNDWYRCEQDSDCVKVPSDCCGCELGALETAVNRDSQDHYLYDLTEYCFSIDPICSWEYSVCTDWPAVCHQGRCKTLRDKCDCGTTWDPVCNGTGAAWTTFGSECEAECADREWHYHGRCDCQMDCDGGPCMRGTCAVNGQTYFCGRSEIECNGQEFYYEGSCDPDCEWCMMLGRPSIPVCDQDFCDQGDVCLADCHGLDWWHQGACLAGEGTLCGTIQGIECPSDDLFCLPEVNAPDAEGVCIALGHCLEPADCRHQPLTVDDCDGSWTCPDHACVWECS